MQEKSFTIHNSINRAIVGDIRYAEGSDQRPLVLVLHGFKGFKDWGFFPYVCRNLAQRGAITVSFNFALNGVSEGSDIFEKLDDFANNTISQEVSDTNDVIQALRSGALEEYAPLRERWNGRLTLLGHSRGGGVAYLVTRDNPDIVTGCALWNSVSRWGRFTDRQKDEWRKQGYLEVPNARTGQILRMKLSYLEDLETNEERLQLNSWNGRSIAVPTLIVNGSQDVTVPAEAGRELAATIRQEFVQKVEIEKTGHTFGAVHPFQGTTPALEELLKITGDFLGL